MSIASTDSFANEKNGGGLSRIGDFLEQRSGNKALCAGGGSDFPEIALSNISPVNSAAAAAGAPSFDAEEGAPSVPGSQRPNFINKPT